MIAPALDLATLDALDTPSSLSRARSALARLQATAGGLEALAGDLDVLLDLVAEEVAGQADPGRLV